MGPARLVIRVLKYRSIRSNEEVSKNMFIRVIKSVSYLTYLGDVQ